MQRDTRQRRAIRRVFTNAGRPLSLDEILEYGKRIVPSLGVATVYRNVKTLVGEGWLSRVKLPGGGLRYELADRPHHHHFLCNSCDQAFDVPQCPDEVEMLAPNGFQVDSHDLTLFGRCAACA
ncbi:MAG: transcriptional repressor [Gemmatimonadota bacterium]|nr:transcriptional repressor [Gemmatimonadota bacterium]